MVKVLSGLLISALLITAPGPRAWSQMAAAARSAAAARPVAVSPVSWGFLGTPFGGLSAAPLGSPAAGLSGILSPRISGPAPRLDSRAALSASPSLAPGRAAGKSHFPLGRAPFNPHEARHSGPDASITPMKPGTPGLRPVRAYAPLGRRLNGIVAAAAPQLSLAADAGAGPGSLRAAGVSLETILTGARTGAFSSPAVDGTPSRAWNPFKRRLENGKCCENHLESYSLPKAAGVSGLGPLPPEERKGFRAYAFGVSAVKVGIETLNLVVPILVLTQTGAATLVGAMFIASELAGLVGGWAASPLIDKFSPARVLTAMSVLQLAAIGAIPALLALNLPVGMPLIFGLFTLNGALSGVFEIARRAQMPRLFGRDEGKLRRYNAMVYVWREVAAIAAVFGAGIWLQHAGALQTLALHPLFYLGAAFAFYRLIKKRRPEAETPASGGRRTAKAVLGELSRGARVVWADPTLRLGAVVNIPVLVLHKLFHAVVAVVYAAQVLGDPALAAVIIGAWNLGELATALYLRYKAKPRSSFSWLRFAALSGLAGWAFWAFPTIWVAAPATFLISTAMLGNELNLASFFQAAAKEEEVGAVTGFIYSLATGVSMLALLGLGWVFDAYAGAPGFLIFAVLMTACSAFFAVSDAVLRRIDKTSPSSPGGHDHDH